MALTREAIDRICEQAQYGLADTVKSLRYAWPMGLIEAVAFCRNYQGNVEGLRKALLDMANLKEGMVFENSAMRIELKAADVAFKEVQSFLIQVLGTMFPDLSFKELQDFCMNIIWHLKGRPSAEELQELFASFSDKFYPTFNEEAIRQL